MRVLLIEDDVDLAANVGEYLEAEGLEVDFAYDGVGGRNLALVEPYDVLVLDLGLPGMDGLDVCRAVRESARADAPILMLTARDELEDKLAGFEAGADDYLLKPFALAELLVRLQALHRRALARENEEVYRVGDLVIEPSLGRITRGGVPIALHRIGEQLLIELARQSPRIVSREELERAIWGREVPDSDLLRSHLYLVRRDVDRPFEVPLIHTIRGRGIRLAVPEDAS